ncbi:MAG TPA: DinB family protein [Thermoanaerobaculia bacterium]|jgi:uncharacterized damage-inducible protein DinB
MTADDIRTLYKYNRWANHRITAACRPLDADAFTRNLGNSFGSIRDTLVHTLWAEWIWLERWQGQSPKQPAVFNDYPDLAAIEKRWSEVENGQESVIAGITDASLTRRIGYENLSNQRWEYSLGHMMQHVANHSTYHRGQVVTMLRQLGAKAVSTDLLLYFDELTT